MVARQFQTLFLTPHPTILGRFKFGCLLSLCQDMYTQETHAPSLAWTRGYEWPESYVSLLVPTERFPCQCLVPSVCKPISPHPLSTIMDLPRLPLARLLNISRAARHRALEKIVHLPSLSSSIFLSLFLNNQRLPSHHVAHNL